MDILQLAAFALFVLCGAALTAGTRPIVGAGIVGLSVALGLWLAPDLVLLFLVVGALAAVVVGRELERRQRRQQASPEVPTPGDPPGRGLLP